MATKFDIKTKDEKKKMISECPGDFLYQSFRFRATTFDPLDEKSCETFKLLEDEIIKRLEFYDDITSRVHRLESK